MNVAIGADHGGFPQKEALRAFLETAGYRMVDVGCRAGEKVDYPDIAVAVCRKVVSGECDRGIILDGAGIGSCMAANKVRGIRAALCYDLRTAVNAREHNNANVLTLGGPLHDAAALCGIARTWLETAFAGGRHIVRVNKIMAIERG
jgi:ribose 5-phosphate isomerase B